MVSTIVILFTLLLSYVSESALSEDHKSSLLSSVSFSNSSNNSVELILSTQVWESDMPQEFFFMVGSDKVVRGILANQGSESYEMDSTVMLSLQTASVVIHIPKEATSGLSQEDFPLERQIRLRHFLMSKLRLKGYKTCTFEEQPASNGITINLNCSARAGWAEAKIT